MKKLLLILLCCLISLSASAKNDLKGYYVTGIISKVLDGDTVLFTDDCGLLVRVRLVAIDAPELNQRHGYAAKKWLKLFIEGKKVRLLIIGRGYYGRILAYIFYKKVDVSEAIIKSGNAWHFKRYNHEKKYQLSEQYAKNHKNGIWGYSTLPVEPFQYRKKHKRRGY